MLTLTKNRVREAENEREALNAKLKQYDRGKDDARQAGINAANGQRVDESILEPYLRTSADAKAFEGYCLQSVALDPKVSRLASLISDRESAIAERKTLHESVHGVGTHARPALEVAADQAATAATESQWLDWDRIVEFRSAKRAYEDVQDRYEHLTKRIRHLDGQIATAQEAATPPWTPDPSSSLPPHQAFPLPAAPTDG